MEARKSEAKIHKKIVWLENLNFTIGMANRNNIEDLWKIIPIEINMQPYNNECFLFPTIILNAV